MLSGFTNLQKLKFGRKFNQPIDVLSGCNPIETKLSRISVIPNDSGKKPCAFFCRIPSLLLPYIICTDAKNILLSC